MQVLTKGFLHNTPIQGLLKLGDASLLKVRVLYKKEVLTLDKSEEALMQQASETIRNTALIGEIRSGEDIQNVIRIMNKTPLSYRAISDLREDTEK